MKINKNKKLNSIVVDSNSITELRDNYTEVDLLIKSKLSNPKIKKLVEVNNGFIEKLRDL